MVARPKDWPEEEWGPLKAGDVNRKQAISQAESLAQKAYILHFFQEDNPDVVDLVDIMTNDHNQEWIVTVRYKNGSNGVIEGTGSTIRRRTYSWDEIMRQEEFNPEAQLDSLFEPREE